MENNWLLIAAGIMILVCMIVGYIRGFIKIIVSAVATIATIILVIFLTPYVSKGIHAFTPLDDMIIKKCDDVMVTQVEKASGELIRNKLSEAGITLPEGLDLSQIKLEDFGLSKKDVSEIIKKAEIPREQQIAAIESANMPEVFREALISNNNQEVYDQLEVDTFGEYIGAYLAKIIIDMISFLLTFIIVTILVRVVVFALSIIADLPVLNGLNRIAGAGCGVIIGLIFIWIAFLVITLLYNFEFGKQCMEMIEDSKILNFLYENNIIMKTLMKF
ncbi:MAG: CvpA family protein [Lachnospiraceae bacterium]|nr:CvpA family protein [Lachnospiraceae bacterium]